MPQYGVYHSSDYNDGDQQGQDHFLSGQQEQKTPQNSYSNHWDEAAFLFCSAGVGLLLNASVIVRILVRPEIRKSVGGAFVIHSCLLDMIKCFFCFPFAISLLWDQQPSHCTLLGGSYVLLVTASGFNIVAMVCCEAYRFSERDFTDISGRTAELGMLRNDADEKQVLPNRYSPNRRRTGMISNLSQFEVASATNEADEAGGPSSGRTNKIFGCSPTAWGGYIEQNQLPVIGCQNRQTRTWFQTSEPNLCEFLNSDGDNDDTSGTGSSGLKPTTSGRSRVLRNQFAAGTSWQCYGSEGNLRNNVIETPQYWSYNESGDSAFPFKLPTDSSEVGISKSKPNENSLACVLFGVVMVYIGSLIVHLGPTIIGGDFNYNDPIGNCLFAYGTVKSYVVHAMWIVIMSLAMLGAIFYLVRFSRHIQSKTGQRLAALVRSSVAVSSGRLKHSADGQSLELRRLSLGRVRVLCLLTAVFVACWYPLYVLTLADPKFQRSVKFYKLLTFVAWSNSSINPLVLILFDRDVGLSSSSCRLTRQCLQSFFKCQFHGGEYNNDADADGCVGVGGFGSVGGGCGSGSSAATGADLTMKSRASLFINSQKRSNFLPLSATSRSQSSSNDLVFDSQTIHDASTTPLAAGRDRTLDEGAEFSSQKHHHYLQQQQQLQHHHHNHQRPHRDVILSSSSSVHVESSPPLRHAGNINNRISTSSRLQHDLMTARKQSSSHAPEPAIARPSDRFRFLPFFGKSSKGLSRSDIIHLERIGSRLGTPDTIPTRSSRRPSFRTARTTSAQNHNHPRNNLYHHQPPLKFQYDHDLSLYTDQPPLVQHQRRPPHPYYHHRNKTDLSSPVMRTSPSSEGVF